MKKIILFLACIFYALNTMAHIGLETKEIIDKSRKRALPIYIFYPTDSKPAAQYAENPVFKGFSATKDAKISKTNLPLYVLAHGTSGNWRNLSWLAARLAENAIVVTANYPDYTTGQATPIKLLKPWNQPKDISFIIDHMLDSEYGESINSQNIAVIGHSLGGYSAMALAGARLNLEQYIDFCKHHDDIACQYFRASLKKLTPAEINTAKQNLFDHRVKASIALAPGYVESMTHASLENLPTSVLIISAENDFNVPSATHLAKVPKTVNRFEVAKSSHFSFLQLCKPDASIILAEEGAEFVCEDSDNRDRTGIHNEIFEVISEFLNNSNSEYLPNTREVSLPKESQLAS